MVSFSCAICLNEWHDPETLRSLPCGHTFCGTCIQEVLNRPNPLCPSCRAGPIKPSLLRPVCVSVEPRNPIARGTPSRRRVSAMSIEILPNLFEFCTNLQDFTPESDMDVCAVVDSLLEVLASERCNENVKNVLLGMLVSFLDTNVASAYEVARSARADNSPAGSSKTYPEIIQALRRELQDLKSDLSADNRHLAKRGEDLGKRLKTTQGKQEKTDEELRNTREELRKSRALALSRQRELASKKLEVGRLEDEVKRAREKARVDEKKYKQLSTDVNEAVEILSRSSEPLNGSLSCLGSTRSGLYTGSNARKSSGIL
ncbi:unnamed protein product [Peniophora sp. CBMAI 1063]|nr:unnamed protein product [Peniophora sp. CBMAI 1063]